MARPKLHILTRISRGLRDDTIDPMAIEDPRCWLWKGSLTISGHPRLRDSQPPHRRLFELQIQTFDPLYVLPTANPNDTCFHIHYPKLGDEKSRNTNLVHNRLTCGEITCINPYHREWFGTRYGKPENWGQKGDDPKDLREPVPLLPTNLSVIPVSPLPTKITEWLQPGDHERPFDELFEILEMDFCEYPAEELHAALTEVLKACT
jgi:hypothetical protein